MADLQISLNNVQNVKTVQIDPIGTFKVRKLGAGEELDMSDKMRRLGEILTELESVDFEGFDSSKDEDRKQIEKLQKRMGVLTEEINDIKRFEYETYMRCFEDEVGGENTKKLFDVISEADRVELFKQIFNPKVVKKEEVANEQSS